MLELNRKNELVQSVFAYIDGENIENAVRIFRKLETKHKILFTFQTEFAKSEFNDKTWIEINLFPFLYDSQLIIAGDVIDDVEILNENFQSLSVTWRHWGQILADWLNQNGIGKPLIGRSKSTKWKYIDFYMDSYASQWIKDYKDWAKAISEVIAEKDKIYSKEYKAI